tara:strand:+ start:128 stop:493 length:366 start_codon:yes stop_codon:yes gene_type:complete
MSKILYVEDNEDNVYMLSRRLKRKGFEIVVATDGEMGVKMAETEKPDLILMDLSLPKMDGWTATKTIKSNEHLNSIPIIALSAHAMDEHKQRALEAGCNDYDTKPVDIDRLLSKINNQLKK